MPATRPGRPRTRLPSPPSRPRPRRRSAWLLPLLAALPILALTLSPSPDDRAIGWDGCVFCGDRGTADALLNVLLFAPFGAALARGRLRPGYAVLLGALFSVGVEAAQLLVPGRDPSPPDLLFNTLGTLAGVAAGLRAGTLLRPSPRAAGRLALAWSLAVAAVVTATGTLSRPVLEAGPLWAQWNTDAGDAAPYPGAVLSARVGPLSLPRGRLPDPAGVRALLRAGEPLAVAAIAAPPPGEASTLFRLADAREREILRIDVDGDDLLLRVRRAGDTLRLDRAPYRLPAAMRGVRPGGELRVSVRLRGSALEVSVDGGRTRPAGPDTGSGWGLLAAVLEPLAPTGVLGFAWMATLLVPLGLWLRPGLPGALALGVAAASVVLVPGWLGMLPGGPSVLAGAAAGLGLGWRMCVSVAGKRIGA